MPSLSCDFAIWFFLTTAFIIQSGDSSLREVTWGNIVTSYLLYWHLRRMISANKIKPIISDGNILIEVKKDINVKDTISLQSQPNENGMCVIFNFVALFT